MELNRLFTDDEAVSPVIGVILMVAITVILAAVIASFVLGVGNQQPENAPKVTIEFDYDEIDENSGSDSKDWGTLEVSHQGGDSIFFEEVKFRGTGFNGSDMHAGSGSYSYDGNSNLDIQQYVRQKEGIEVHTTTAGSWNDTVASGQDSKIVSGDYNNLYVSSDYEIGVVYQPEEGGSSSTLKEGSGPEA